MFISRLFEEHSELLNMFEKFRELKTKEEQANSMELAEHANNVMQTLDEGIKGLDDLDTFFAFLDQVGASHTRIPGFKVDYFWVSSRGVCVVEPSEGTGASIGRHISHITSNKSLWNKRLTNEQKWQDVILFLCYMPIHEISERSNKIPAFTKLAPSK